MKLTGSCNLWITFLSLVVLNIFVSNLQFKFIIDGQNFLLIAGLCTYIYIYYIYMFKQHSLPEKKSVGIEFFLFYKIEVSWVTS